MELRVAISSAGDNKVKTKVKPLTSPGVQFLAPCATQRLPLQYILQLAEVALQPIMTSLPSCRIQPLVGGVTTSGHPITVIYNFTTNFHVIIQENRAHAPLRQNRIHHTPYNHKIITRMRKNSASDVQLFYSF